ncbi:MAG: lipocalin family protein [Alphaproteobacteria bacterium]
MFNRAKNVVTALCAGLFLTACTGIPKDIAPVTGFESEKYLGTWYEIARLDHSFERGMDNVTANYSMREDGGIRVLNRGFETKKDAYDTAEGKAYFVDEETIGHLEVSFFGPFYASYVIFDLDKENYSQAYISGNTKKYLWYLSRTPTVTDEQKRRFIDMATDKGFDTDALIWVDHSKAEP